MRGDVDTARHLGYTRQSLPPKAERRTTNVLQIIESLDFAGERVLTDAGVVFGRDSMAIVSDLDDVHRILRDLNQ